jgi:hypothetical protein
MALEGRILTVECPCAGTPHQSDKVTFRRVLSLAGGLAAITAMREAARGDGELDQLTLATHVFPVFLAHAIESWTFLGEDGNPLPIPAGDDVLPFGTKYLIADAADDLFGEEVTRPLAGMIRRSLPAGRTGRSTSPKRPSGGSRRSRSAPSSPAASEAMRP